MQEQNSKQEGASPLRSSQMRSSPFVISPLRSSPLRSSPLRSPEMNKYKNEWAYLQDIQAKKQEEAIDTERRLQDEIKNRYRQDLKQSIEQQKQQQKREQEYERYEELSSPQPLHDKQISLFQEMRQQALGKISHDCLDFNSKIADQRREAQQREKERDRVEADRRIRDAMQSQLSYQDMQREEKNFMKNELLNANHAQEEIKRMEAERQKEKNRAFVEIEKQELQEQESRREDYKRGIKQKYFQNNQNSAVSGMFMENHLKQVEDRKNFERVIIDEYNQRQRQAEDQRMQQEQQIKKQVNNNVISTLKTQMAIKQEVQAAQQLEKQRYNQFLSQKDKEVEEWQNQRKMQEVQLRKELNSELVDQILTKNTSKNDFMDQRELIMNKQLFENGQSSSVPGMTQDHRRVKQLSMVSQSLGYQNAITTPETVQLYSHRKLMQPGGTEEYSPRKTESRQGLQRNGSLALLSSRTSLDQYKSESLSPVKFNKNRESLMSLPKIQQSSSNVFVQSGKNIFG